MTMSSIFNSGPSFFSRSRSSSNIPDLVKTDPPKVQKISKKAELPRAASYTYLPVQEENTSSAQDVARSGNDEGESGYADDGREGRTTKILGKEERPRLSSVGRKKSLGRPKSWIQKGKGSQAQSETVEVPETVKADTSSVFSSPKQTRENRRKSVSGSIVTFARKSWIGSSRSPSPTKRSLNASDKIVGEGGERAQLGRVASTADISHDGEQSTQSPGGSPQKPPLERRSTFQKLRQRPQSVLMSLTNMTSANSSTSSLHSSLENKSTPRTSIEKMPPLPKNFSTEKLLSGGDGHKKRDELAASFRSLDNDFSKFQSKSWSLKTNVVRSALLPFLKNHATHPSNENLRPEDLEKRTAVLIRWWAGLLEVLDGRQNQTVSGVDRPVLLEACYCIMVRPEWRAAPSQFAPLCKRASYMSGRPSLKSRKSSASMRSMGSQLVTEAIMQNVRAQFVQNLLTQVLFVVEKMSLRHTPASLTTFCGKALAYAFFFVPGIADVLVRVWKLSAETLRRVVDEYGLPVRPNMAETIEVVSSFPSHLAGLGWSSPKAMFSQLRKNASLTGAASKIRWYGPWTARWCGRDTDLLFVFAKHYFILCEEFLGPDVSLKAKCRSPGFILLQAQLMTVLDGTTHRQHPDNTPVVLDDSLGADAVAAALPFTNNSARPMAENRLVMLLRDFLSEHSSEHATAQRTFAEVFSKTVQASAHKTSLYDHHACFILCDFMEESVQIFVRYQVANPAEPDRVDWFLWMKVCQKMLDSHNTMTQIRLFAFLYALWNMITSESKRKEVIALDWLLAEETFTKFFSHWCPMVRAYYMRLLCWRLCRDDGEASTLDTKIFSVVSTRLKTVFAHYLFSKNAADGNNTQLPSSTPCNPAPGRRFLIIRNDFQAPAANMFLGFDGILPATNAVTAGSNPFKRHSGFGASPDTAPLDQGAQRETRKRWNILGKTNPHVQATSSSAPVTPSSSPPNDVDDERRELAHMRMSRPPLQRAPSSSTRTRSEPPASYKTYCFKFSLEWAQHFDRNIHRTNNPMKIVSPRLPNPAQACISARVPGTGMEVRACDPGTHNEGTKYSGRALAEWAIIVGECNNFVERRRMEGVPGLKFVEVPLLGVDGFRKFGG